MRKPLVFITLLAAVLSGCMQSDPLRSALGSYRNYTDFNGKIADGALHDPHGRFIIVNEREEVTHLRAAKIDPPG